MNRISKYAQLLDLGWLDSRVALTIAVLIAGWPVVRWYLARLHDGADEPLGLLALVAALVFAPRSGWTERVSVTRLGGTAWVLAGYVVGFAFLPPLGRALIWVGALALAAAPAGFAWAWSALLVLSLPFVASLQFYLGYPLRCLTTQVAALILRFGGVDARSEATVLHWAGERVLIDAPCSGIQMLWTLLLVAAVLANLRRWNGRTTLTLFRFAGAIVFLANSLRAVALFCLELRLWPRLPLGHEAVGLTLFAVAGAALLWIAERLEEGRSFSIRRFGLELLFGRRQGITVM